MNSQSIKHVLRSP